MQVEIWSDVVCPWCYLGKRRGLDHDGVLRVLASEEYGDAVDADEAMARSLGASGVPFFVIDRRFGIPGAQPAETIAQTLDRAWAGVGTP
jgi:predicted DsbA family dithiol-disulfide isomerase